MWTFIADLIFKLGRIKNKIARHIRSRYYAGLFRCGVKPLPKIAPGVIFSCPCNIRCGKNLVVNPQVYFAAKGGINIGDDVTISAGAKIISSGLTVVDGKVCRKHEHRTVIIGNGVWIGAGAIILPGVTIGADCIIAAGAVVTKDCPGGFVYAGIPAKAVRQLTEIQN